MKNNIRELREAKRLKQSELAEIIGNDSNTISRWERNKIGIGSAYIMKLAQALGTSTDYLLGKTDDPLPDSKNSQNISASGEDYMPYTQEQIMNGGMLVYELGNGKRIVLPPSKDSYDFLKDIALRIPQTAVMA